MYVKKLVVLQKVTWFLAPFVTKQRVTEQGFCGCVFCVNARIADQGFRVNPAVSFINESGGFYPFWKKVSVGCAWDAWRGCYLVVWDGIAGGWWREWWRGVALHWWAVEEKWRQKGEGWSLCGKPKKGDQRTILWKRASWKECER